MLVVLGFYKRKPGMSHEEFSKYWRTVHGPMLRDNPELAPNMTYYAQHHLNPNSAGGLRELGFDGFSEVWYASQEARDKVRGSAAFASVQEDEAMFIDMSETRVSMFDTRHVMIDNR